MHFRFGEKAGEIYLDDIEVIDLQTNSVLIPKCDFENGQASFAHNWTFWPPGEKNTVGKIAVANQVGNDHTGGLKVTLNVPKLGRWPDFHIYH